MATKSWPIRLWIVLVIAACVFPPVGVVNGPTDHLTFIFRGQWAWIGQDIANLYGLNGRGCIHLWVLLGEISLITAVFGVISFAERSERRSLAHDCG